MKKIKLLLLTILLLIPVRSILADEFSAVTTLTCPDTQVNSGGSITCTVSVNVNKPITDFRADINPEGLTITAWASSATWKDPNDGDYSNGRIEADIREGTATGDVTLGSITIKFADTASGRQDISLTDVNYFNDNTTYATAPNSNTVTVTVNPVSTGLRNLTITGGTLSQQFSTSETRYSVILPVDSQSFSIVATKATENDGIVFTNSDTNTNIDPTNIPFATAAGKSSMSIKITVGSGGRKVEYTLLVARETSDSVGEPTLSSLIVGGKNITISGEDIDVALPGSSSYVLKATLSDKANYTFSIPSGFNSCVASDGDLECTLQGENSFPINVVSIASGGKSKTYIVNIKKNVNESTTTTDEPTPIVSENPQTGSGVAFIMAFVLVVSFATSLYLYKRNMKNFEQ